MSESKFLDTAALLHEPMVAYWQDEYEEYTKQRYTVKTRIEMAIEAERNVRVDGDEILEKIEFLFNHGFGMRFSAMQHKIFKALVNALLPRIYMQEWLTVKRRIMKQRKITEYFSEVLVNAVFATISLRMSRF